MVNTLRVNAHRARDFHPDRSMADHVTKLHNFTKIEIRELSAFLFSVQLMFDQRLTNLIVCLMISQKRCAKVAQSRWHVVADTG